MKKGNPIPVRLELWEVDAIRDLSDVESLNQSETLRLIINAGLEHFQAHPELLATAYLKYKKDRKARIKPRRRSAGTIARDLAISEGLRNQHKKPTAA